MNVVFSVDLEPNPGGSVAGIADAMEWYAEVVPEGTVFVTRDAVRELPEVVASLAGDFEVGVHVHPAEFGHDHDRLALLAPDRQRRLVAETRSVVSLTAGIRESAVTSFRAGRHSANGATLSVLSDLGFAVDASMHVRYDDHLPDDVLRRQRPFRHASGLVEVPTTYVVPPLVSRVGLAAFPNRTVTATSGTLRSDDLLASGPEKFEYVLDHAPAGVSAYMHPYDAIDTGGDRTNTGSTFRRRVERAFDCRPGVTFRTVQDIASAVG